MAAVVTVGELLVEIMRPGADAPFTEPGEFVGPFPSGAPAIFADAVAHLGHDAALIGCVGADGFGRLQRDRLERDGVDVSGVRTTDRRATGVAFVAYFGDGSREFVFHVEHAASGLVGPDDVSSATVETADAIHLTGSSLLVSEGMREACHDLLERAHECDLLVSVDPNVRPELLDTDDRTVPLESLLERADVVTPTADELRYLVADDAIDEDRAVRALLENETSLVAVTKGADGCSLYTARDEVHHEGFGPDVDVVDPTGAGDAFAAAITVGTFEGMALEERAAFANAAGALATAEQGPMEGVASRAAIESLLEGERE